MTARRMTWLLGAVLAASGGCEAIQKQRDERVRKAEVRQALKSSLEADIIQLVTFYSNNPFMSFDPDGDPNPEGVKVSAFYAISGKTGKGAHANGLTRFKLYVIQRQDGEEPFAQLVKTWEFTPEAARDWRVTRQTTLGWPYQFHLNWGELDLAGREIRLVPEFVRLDGQIIQGSAKDLKVPPRKYGVRYSDDQAANR